MVLVMSLGSSSSRYPTATLVPIRAMGKPVALEASADERDTRGFISITSCSPVVGLTANWMLQPPAATPISRMILMAASRMT